jgi:antitoxin (DNA-binding transcriptional repressor) of toxin-antitoxin stability system
VKRVGVREFKTKATALIAEGESLVIEKHGKPVGFYIPLQQKDKAKARAAAERFEQTLAGILQRTGMTREEFDMAWEQAGRRGA